MATSTMVPVNEYLATMYRPDCDYVNGEVLERNMGELDHAELQGQVFDYLRRHRREWNVRVYLELRVQVGRNYRVPDVCLLKGDAPVEQIITYPPLLCIEVLSPEDSMHRVRGRVKDFLAMGVRQVWIFDSKSRTATVCEGDTMVEVREGELRLPDSPVRVPLAEIFSALDR